MAADAFQKIKSSINRSVTAINVKTSSSLEKAKLKTQIDALTSEVQRMNTAVGEAFYLIWNRGESDFSCIYEHLEVIKQKKAEIDALNAECAAIDERSNQILSSGNENNVLSASDILTTTVCTNCGTPYAEGAKFCRKCGNKLQAE